MPPTMAELVAVSIPRMGSMERKGGGKGRVVGDPALDEE